MANLGYLQLTRDCYQHCDPAPPRDPAFALFRDRTTGFVSLFYTTGRSLLSAHPRAEVRAYGSEPEARAALESLGRPPVVEALPG